MQEIQTDKAVQTPSPYSRAIKDGDRVYVSGQVGFDAGGDLIGDDVQAQTEQALENVSAILEAAGGSLDDVVKTTVFLTDADDFDAFNGVYREVLSEPYPARSAVITDLAAEGLKVEIDAIASV